LFLYIPLSATFFNSDDVAVDWESWNKKTNSGTDPGGASPLTAKKLLKLTVKLKKFKLAIGTRGATGTRDPVCFDGNVFF
jgi:hypothetical protein